MNKKIVLLAIFFLSLLSFHSFNAADFSNKTAGGRHIIQTMDKCLAMQGATKHITSLAIVTPETPKKGMMLFDVPFMLYSWELSKLFVKSFDETLATDAGRDLSFSLSAQGDVVYKREDENTYTKSDVTFHINKAANSNTLDVSFEGKRLNAPPLNTAELGLELMLRTAPHKAAKLVFHKENELTKEIIKNLIKCSSTKPVFFSNRTGKFL